MADDTPNEPTPVTPSDDEPLEPIEPTDVARVPELVALARRAQKDWSAIPLSERAARLRDLAPRALRRAEELADLIHRETGKPVVEALLAEVLSIADLGDYWTLQSESLLEPNDIELDPLTFPGKVGRISRVPRGVIALITPWNYPVIIPMRHLLPALLAGNAVVLKPSEASPHAGRVIASLFEGLLPDGLLTIVQGGADVGAALLAADIDAVSFTGGVDAGRKVATACAARLMPCSLELGGNDAAIVLADARLERAARGIVWAAFTNAGQNCAAIERVYVERPIADAFIARVVALTRELRPDHDIGPMLNEAQSRRVSEQLEQAVALGAEVLTGGAPDDGTRVFSPTVVRVESEESELMTKETFGPVLPIVVVESEDDAIDRANNSPYGLTVSVWTRRVGHGRWLSQRLRAGVVTINNPAFTAALPMAPWSGVGLSGSGVTNGPYALDGYTRPLFVLTDRSRAARELWWYPYNETLTKLALAMARARGGAGFFGRILAFFALLMLLPKRLLSDK